MEYIDDIIHGTIPIPEYINSIIQTPQFQRLKKIKQLGFTYKFLPLAKYNRYEHCIGTYYLANKVLDALEKNTKDLKIPDLYRKAVTIAALLHDVGHGPFSHTWEFICCRQYNHEENAANCIDEIFKVCLTDWDVDRPYAIALIKALIVDDDSCLQDKEYRFLFDIVHNTHCSVDVDKWDYLLRDYFHISDVQTPEVNLDFSDVFLKARASADRAHIEFRYCDFDKIYNIFDARTAFHIYFYQRPFNRCMEQIFKYIMSECEDNLEQINGLKLKDIRSKHVSAFLQLNDDEVWRILRELKSPEEFVQLVNCLENPNIIQVYPETDEEKLLIAEHLRVQIRIANAGEELKSDNLIFYGNEADKPIFDQKKGFHTSVSYFQIRPSST